jgi:hypothetical protein
MLQTNPGMIDMANFRAKQQHFAGCRMQLMQLMQMHRKSQKIFEIPSYL